MAKVEIEKRITDELERERVALKKVEQVKAANRALLEETDRMKLLRSRRMISDIEEVRKRQIAQKAMLKRLRDRADREFDSEHARAQQAYDKRGQVAQEQKQEKRMEVAKEIREQLEASKAREIGRLEQIRRDGIRMREEAESAAAEEQRKEDARRALLRRNNMQMQAVNRDLQAHKADHARVVAEEDARMEAFVAGKQA